MQIEFSLLHEDEQEVLRGNSRWWRQNCLENLIKTEVKGKNVLTSRDESFSDGTESLKQYLVVRCIYRPSVDE